MANRPELTRKTAPPFKMKIRKTRQPPRWADAIRLLYLSSSAKFQRVKQTTPQWSSRLATYS